MDQDDNKEPDIPKEEVAELMSNDNTNNVPSEMPNLMDMKLETNEKEQTKFIGPSLPPTPATIPLSPVVGPQPIDFKQAHPWIVFTKEKDLNEQSLKVYSKQYQCHDCRANAIMAFEHRYPSYQITKFVFPNEGGKITNLCNFCDHQRFLKNPGLKNVETVGHVDMRLNKPIVIDKSKEKQNVVKK